MTDNTRHDPSRSAGADPNTTALLRTAYRPPTDDSYWGGLEQRVMQRITAGLVHGIQELKPAWWSGFGEFRTWELRTAGLVAATIGLLVAGSAVARDQATDQRARDMAARDAVESALPLPIDDVMLTRARPNLPPDAPERYLNPLDY